MRYTVKKLTAFLFTMVVVSLLTFIAFDLISGDPAQAMLGTEATPEKLAALREQLGLNQPLLVRYGQWLAGFFTGNLGTSYNYNLPVGQLIAPKLGLTLCLSFLAFVLTVIVSIPLGMWSARHAGGRADALFTTLNQFFMAVPPFFTGLLFTWVFSLMLGWFVHGKFPGFGLDAVGSLWYLLFPAMALALPRIAMTVRMLRSTILSEMNKDYVRTAISRGNDWGMVLRRHVLKNSLVPVVTFLAQTMAEIALSTVLLGGGIGVLVGALTGYFGGIVDEVLMRLNDALNAFPSVLLALVIVSVLGSGKYNVVIALSIVFVPSFARVSRTAFAALRDANYVKSARLMGASPLRILAVQILPNTLHVLLPAFTIGFNNAVLAEASMSYLGIGVKPPDASLGYMLSESQSMLSAAPWYALCTGMTIVLLIFGGGLIGEGMNRQNKGVG